MHQYDTTEEWRPVVGFEGRYEVSSFGRVRSTLTRVQPDKGARWIAGGKARTLTLKPNRTGYLRAALYNGITEGHRRYLVHHLVLEAFVGPRPERMDGCHNDDDRTNNRIDNLKWGTPEQNWEDRKRNGRSFPAQGESHGMAKLTTEQVLAIRKRSEQGWTNPEIAQDTGLNYTNVWQIVTRRTWKHLA